MLRMHSSEEEELPNEKPNPRKHELAKIEPRTSRILIADAFVLSLFAA